MFRRSNSASNIPLPRRDSKGNARSRSSSRLSQRDSVTQLRKPSIDRKGVPSSASKNYLTPVQHTRLSRASSTPNTLNSKRARSPRLLNDKQWVIEQHAKVQHYLQTDINCDKKIANPNNIKPPSINAFIHICSLLLGKMFPRIKITNDNFKDVIPTHLKMLKYPGPVSSSSLRIANTMHAWPQVISILAWLVDFVTLYIEGPEPVKFDGDEQNIPRNLTLATSNFLVSKFLKFNDGAQDVDDGDEDDEIDRKYVETLEDIWKIDNEKLAQLEEQVEQLKSKRNTMALRLKHSKEENERIRQENKAKREEIENFNEQYSLEKNTDEIEIERLKKQKVQLGLNQAVLTKEISDLREAISKQLCSLDDKKRLLAIIEGHRSRMELKKKEIQSLVNIKDEFDCKLADLKRKIEVEVHRWNVSLVKIFLDKPEFKELQLRDRGFHVPNFKEEIDMVLEKKVQIEKVYLDAIEREKNEVLVNTKDIEKLTKLLVAQNHDISKLHLHYTELKTKIPSVKNEIEKAKLCMESEKKLDVERMEILKQEWDIHEKETRCNELKNRKLHLENSSKELAENQINFFVQLNKQIKLNLMEMDKLLCGVQEKLVEASVKKKHNIAKLIEIVKNVQEQGNL